MDYDILVSLRKLGLTTYEAKTYFALLRFGMLTASEISSITGVPYPKVYTSIEKLKSFNLVSVAGQRPSMFKVEPPSKSLGELRDRMIEDIRKTSDLLISELTPLYTAISKMRFYGRTNVLGRSRINRTLSKIISKTSKSISISLPIYEPIPHNKLLQTLLKLSKKNVTVRLIVQSDELEKRAEDLGFEVKKTTAPLPLMLISDDKTVMVVNKFETEDGLEQWSGIISSCPECIKNVVKMFQNAWNGEILTADIERVCLTRDEVKALMKYLREWPSRKDISQAT
ncbi:TrmB family transcriptional regulator [Candidatus Bathyarchaeota archaeon]|nr:TrmB family transcriptional regulator [Candidatus Bathyarchaeota archaeon]